MIESNGQYFDFYATFVDPSKVTPFTHNSFDILSPMEATTEAEFYQKSNMWESDRAETVKALLELGILQTVPGVLATCSLGKPMEGRIATFVKAGDTQSMDIVSRSKDLLTRHYEKLEPVRWVRAPLYLALPVGQATVRHAHEELGLAVPRFR